MPELPEVETTRRGIEPHVLGRQVTRVQVRQPRLRWPVTPELSTELTGRRFQAVSRRGKYLLFAAGDKHLMIHLGMSGRLRVVPSALAPTKHDHLDIALDSGQTIRFNDPRRFGSAFWLAGDPAEFPLLASLGPEPLTNEFNGQLLYRRSRGRSAPVKAFIMDSKTVVGVGNIYASEALHAAGIHPARAAGRISLNRYEKLALAIKQTLETAITAGGTTLRDYVGVDGATGWFQLQLAVYGKAGQPCPSGCGAIRQRIIGQRNTFFCPMCQR